MAKRVTTKVIEEVETDDEGDVATPLEPSAGLRRLSSLQLDSGNHSSSDSFLLWRAASTLARCP
jgi:hypothetical protein